MAEKAKRIRTERMKRRKMTALAEGRKMKFSTRVFNRCERCGRVRGYIGFLNLCRICVRDLAREGKIAGMRKSSW